MDEREIMEQMNPEPEAEQTAQEPAGAEEVVDPQMEEDVGDSHASQASAGESTEEPEVTDGESEEEEEGGPGRPAPQTEKAAQSHQDNAAARSARKRAEAETTQRLRREYDEQVAGLGIPNPYTGRPFQSFKEFREYGERFKAEQLQKKARETGKSIDELREEEEAKGIVAQRRAEEKRQREAMEALKAMKDFAARDLDEFMARYPGVDPGKLEKNPRFRKFAGKRLYKEPLAELYSDFVELVSDAEHSAVEKAAGKARRSTGGGAEGGKDLLTPAQREALEEWNRDNPGMRMSPKEFLSR